MCLGQKGETLKRKNTPEFYLIWNMHNQTRKPVFDSPEKKCHNLIHLCYGESHILEKQILCCPSCVVRNKWEKFIYQQTSDNFTHLWRTSDFCWSSSSASRWVLEGFAWTWDLEKSDTELTHLFHKNNGGFIGDQPSTASAIQMRILINSNSFDAIASTPRPAYASVIF